MYMSISSRAAASYRMVGTESVVHGASAHQLIAMLFDSTQKAIGAARDAMARKDIPAKGQQIGQAIRIIQEGLIAHLDADKGGSIADNLLRLYEYCTLRLTQANLRNDAKALDEVAQLLDTIAKGWGDIREMGSSQLQVA